MNTRGAFRVGVIATLIGGVYFVYSYYSSKRQEKTNKPLSSGSKNALKESLKASVDLYKSHIVVGTGSADWPSKVEDANVVLNPECELVKRLSMILKEKKNTLKDNFIKLSASSDEPFSVTIFPDQVRYENVSLDDVPIIIQNHFVLSKIPSSPDVSPGCKIFRFGRNQKPTHFLNHFHYFVYICTHNNRDKACGTMGPLLIDEFKKLTNTDPSSKPSLPLPKFHDISVRVLAISHIGGHKYAGNAIIYRNDSTQNQPNTALTSSLPYTGDWYGYLDCRHVEALIQEHMRENQIMKPHWRGRMGCDKTTQATMNSDESDCAKCLKALEASDISF